MPTKQPKKDFINVNGFKLRNGKMDLKTGFLEEENIREFDFDLPLFSLSIIRKKNLNYRIHLNEPIISLYIGYNSIESFHFDIEEEYLRGLENYENQFEKQEEGEMRERKKTENNKPKIPLKGIQTTQKKTSYFIQIPILNPYFKNTVSQFHLKFAFYFRSHKPQSYWMKRNTMIVFEC